MYNRVEEFLDLNSGVATVSEMAELLGEDEGFVRRWAREHDVRRAGSTFVFGHAKALELADELESDAGDKDLEALDEEDEDADLEALDEEDEDADLEAFDEEGEDEDLEALDEDAEDEDADLEALDEEEHG